MEPLRQYIDLYNGSAVAFDVDTPTQLTALRQRAINTLQRGVPTGLADVLSPDYGINVNRHRPHQDAVNSLRCGVHNVSGALYYTAADIMLPSPVVRPLEGVTVTTLREAATEHRQWLSRLASIADVDDTAVALNTLLAQDGILVHVDEGVNVAKPVQLVSLGFATMPLLAASRLLVLVERGAGLQLLCCDHSDGSGVANLALRVTEVFAAENSTVELYDLEETDSTDSRVSRTIVNQAAGSNVLVDTITLSGGFTDNSITVHVNGERAETTLLGMAIESENQRVNNRTLIAHHSPRCMSNEMYKYVLNDSSNGSFVGRILVDEGCPCVEAYQGNRNLSASPSARMHSEPQLEIYTDDVRCSHGSATGQLDEQALFYMRSRGIPEDEARTMLMQAFVADVIDGVRLESLRDRLRLLVERRFHGELADCAACRGGKSPN